MTFTEFLGKVDDLVWGVPLMVLILAGGLLLTIRLKVLQTHKLGLALKWMVKNEEGGTGEVTSFAALCTALSATIGTGKDYAIGLDVHIDAVHHEANLVVGCGEETTVDAVEQYAGRHLDASGVVAHGLCHRVRSCIHRHHDE